MTAIWSVYLSGEIHSDWRERITDGVKAAGLPEDAIQMVPVTDRAAVGEMLKGLNGNLDVIVPRGGKSLVARVQEEARVPVFAHLEGLVHIFVDKAAFRVRAAATLPPLEAMQRHVALPSQEFPSDHVWLACDVEWK